MNIFDFWVAFLGGLASGIFLTVVTAFVRGLFRKPVEGKQKLQGDTKVLRLLILIFTGLVLIILALLFYDKIGKTSLWLIIPAVLIIAVAATETVSDKGGEVTPKIEEAKQMGSKGRKNVKKPKKQAEKKK
jgi:hypothetical protein